jgi:hypothetical protein
LQLPQDQFFSQNENSNTKKSLKISRKCTLKLLLLIKRAIIIQSIMENGEVVDAFET